MADPDVRQPADDDIKDLSRMAVDYARKAGLSEADDPALLGLLVAAYRAGVRRAAAQIELGKKDLIH